LALSLYERLSRDGYKRDSIVVDVFDLPSSPPCMTKLPMRRVEKRGTALLLAMRVEEPEVFRTLQRVA
jgi:hypothetical protein